MFKSIKILIISLALGTSLQSVAISARNTTLPGTQIGVAYLLPNSNAVYGQNIDTFMNPQGYYSTCCCFIFRP
mgnify:CR=1 FL=1